MCIRFKLYSFLICKHTEIIKMINYIFFIVNLFCTWLLFMSKLGSAQRPKYYKANPSPRCSRTDFNP